VHSIHAGVLGVKISSSRQKSAIAYLSGDTAATWPIEHVQAHDA
jgi:hypothetical protein